MEEVLNEMGILVNTDPVRLANNFVKAIAKHRFWEREKGVEMPA